MEIVVKFKCPLHVSLPVKYTEYKELWDFRGISEPRSSPSLIGTNFFIIPSIHVHKHLLCARYCVRLF